MNLLASWITVRAEVAEERAAKAENELEIACSDGYASKITQRIPQGAVGGGPSGLYPKNTSLSLDPQGRNPNLNMIRLCPMLAC